MKILLTNDDGIGAPGLLLLTSWAKTNGHDVTVVAPKTNQSGKSGAITLGQPLAVEQVDDNRWVVDGTPADCVRVAATFLSMRPQLVISGVNHGWNLGEDIYASGTVGAARLASLRGIPALALSGPPVDWDNVQTLMNRHTHRLVSMALNAPRGTIISVNFPSKGGDRLAWCGLSGPRYQDQVSWAQLKGQTHWVRLDFSESALASHDVDTDAVLIREGVTTASYIPLQDHNSASPDLIENV